MLPNRIREVSNGITAEAISEQTHLFYDPSTKLARVVFQYRDNLYTGDTLIGPSGDWGTLSYSITELVGMPLGVGLVDPVTEQPLDNVSAAGVSLLIKAAFALLWDARVAAEATGGDVGSLAE
jgi:hypothetical protein